MCALDYMYMYIYTCTCRCLWRSEEGVTPLELSVTVSVNCLMWVLETKPMSSARAVCTLNRWANSPALVYHLFVYMCTHMLISVY